MRDRSIIHFNITDFAVAVERLQDSSLREYPVIVAPEQAARALVYDMSEEAYQDGVRKGMRLDTARRYCPGANVLQPRPVLYRKVMHALVQRVVQYTPRVERGAEDGHLFMDVTGTHRLFGPAPDIALRLRKQLVQELGLNPIWSLAGNKLISKVASRVVRPVGEYIVAAGEERAFLAPLSLSLLPGVKAAEIRVLSEFNLVRIGQLAQLTREQLRVPFKKRGEYLYEISRGVDTTPVVSGNSEKERITREYHFDDDTGSRRELYHVLTSQVHEAGRCLRREGKLARRVGISLTYSDGRSVVRQATEKRGTDNDFQLRRLAVTAFERAWQRRVRIRSYVLICDRLLACSRQQTLFSLRSPAEEKQEKIIAAMDRIYSRFGSTGIRLGTA